MRLGPDARAEVIAGTAVLVLALKPRLRLERLPEMVKEATTEHWRMFSQFNTLSLDAKLPGSDSGASWIDMLASDVEHF